MNSANEEVANADTRTSFWQQEPIKRASAALDIWASVKRSQIEGCRGIPTIEAIFAPDDPEIGEDGYPLHDSEKPNRVKVMIATEYSVMDDDDVRRWVVIYHEEWVKRHKSTSSEPTKSLSLFMSMSVDAWLKDIGSPPLLPSFLMAAYPKRGPYEQTGEFDASWFYGTMNAGRSESRLRAGVGSLHRAAIRDLADWLADYGIRKAPTVKRRRLRVNGEEVMPSGGNPQYGSATDEEASHARKARKTA